MGQISSIAAMQSELGVTCNALYEPSWTGILSIVLVTMDHFMDQHP
jgi:hypothetical protein